LTADGQLNLLGAPDQPCDLDLGTAQRAVLRELRRLGTITRPEAGAVVHAGRGKHAAGDTCVFCPGHGALVLESLIRRGLAEAGPDGSVQLPRTVEASDVAYVEDDRPGWGIPF
jgi:hypothetical protein